MSLLAPPAAEQIEVPVCAQVLHHGSRARSEGGRGEPLFAHRFVPPVPKTMPDEHAWRLALDFAEEVRRYEQAGRAVLDLEKPGYSGASGRSGPGTPRLWSSSRGVEVDDALVRWPRLFAGRREQREVEVEIARARDLAQAYSSLDYYGRVYPEPREGDSWTPVPLIRRLASEARELGGDPTLLEPHTEYMRQGLG